MKSRRFGHTLLLLAVLLTPAAAVAADPPSPSKKAAKAPEAGARSSKSGKSDKSGKKADKNADKVAKRKAEEAERDSEARLVRKIRGSTLTVTADGDIKTISDDGKIIPFPSQAGAVKKAFSQVRRDQLGDAERSARAAKEEDRWWTVLFHIRSMDSRNDAEACFWRAIAFYRMGEIARARNTRQFCESEAALGDEDALSASLQPMAALPEMQQPGDPKPTPVPNLSPYAGPGPTKLEK
jgi:hypothetical protein